MNIKPKKIKFTTEMVIYPCNEEGHRHQTESAALNCIKRNEFDAKVSQDQYNKFKRNKEIMLRIMKGETYESVAIDYGIGRNRIGRIFFTERLNIGHCRNHEVNSMLPDDFWQINTAERRRIFLPAFELYYKIMDQKWKKRFGRLNPATKDPK